MALKALIDKKIKAILGVNFVYLCTIFMPLTSLIPKKFHGFSKITEPLTQLQDLSMTWHFKLST
jgi:hypothetical protein